MGLEVLPWWRPTIDARCAKRQFADFRHPASFAKGFHSAAIITAVSAIAAGLVAWLTIRNDVLPEVTQSGEYEAVTTGSEQLPGGETGPALAADTTSERHPPGSQDI